MLAIAPSQALPTDRSPVPVRIAVLTVAWGPPAPIPGLIDGLAELGYRENEDFVIAVWFAEGDAAALPERAARMLANDVDVVLAVGPMEAEAAAEATAETPIVFLYVDDPISLGLIETYARPGGNVTGVANGGFGISRRRLQLFGQMVPGMQRVLFPFNASNQHQSIEAELFAAYATEMGIEIVSLPIERAADLDQIPTLIISEDIDGILAPKDVDMNIPGVLVDVAARASLPTMFQIPEYVEVGGLASYGADSEAIGKQAARLIDRILRGSDPATIPVETPDRLSLVVNLRTATEIGLPIPEVILFMADRIIR